MKFTAVIALLVLMAGAGIGLLWYATRTNPEAGGSDPAAEDAGQARESGRRKKRKPSKRSAPSLRNRASGFSTSKIPSRRFPPKSAKPRAP